MAYGVRYLTYAMPYAMPYAYSKVFAHHSNPLAGVVLQGLHAIARALSRTYSRTHARTHARMRAAPESEHAHVGATRRS